ncbi:MAG: hypothetical protein ACKVZJ_10225 [Phycisphaerales bacterium]
MQKDFDCVEMKRKGQETLRRRLAGMTREQQLAYWTRRNEELRESQRSAVVAQRKSA